MRGVKLQSRSGAVAQTQQAVEPPFDALRTGHWLGPALPGEDAQRRRGISSHRVFLLELGPLPFAGFEHLAQLLHRLPHVFKAEVERGEAEAQYVFAPRSS